MDPLVRENKPTSEARKLAFEGSTHFPPIKERIPSPPEVSLSENESDIVDLCSQYLKAVETKESSLDPVTLGLFLGAIHDKFIKLSICSLGLLELIKKVISSRKLNGSEQTDKDKFISLEAILLVMNDRHYRDQNKIVVKDSSNDNRLTEALSIPKEVARKKTSLPPPPPPDQFARGDSLGNAQQIKVFEIVSRYNQEDEIIPILREIALLSDEDLSCIENDRSTAQNLFAIYQEFISMVSQTESIRGVDAALFFVVTNMMIRHPQCDMLFTQGAKGTPGSFTFCASIIDKTLPLDIETAKSIALNTKAAKAYSDVWTEASMYMRHVFVDSMLEMRYQVDPRSTEEKRGRILLGLRIASKHLPSLKILTEAKGTGFGVSIGTVFAIIGSLDQSDMLDDADVDRFFGPLATFKQDCIAICDSLIPHALAPRGESEVDLKSLEKQLTSHKMNVFANISREPFLSIAQRAKLFHVMRKIRRENVANLPNSPGILRQAQHEIIRKMNLNMNTIIDISIQTRFFRDKKRYNATIRAIESSLCAISPRAPIQSIDRTLTAAQKTVSFRLCDRDPRYSELEQRIDQTKSEFVAHEFERLKRVAVDFQKHEYSQFNRPTESHRGEWFPKVSYNARTGNNQLDYSPVSGACSCNATMTLVNLLTPRINKDEATFFDRVMDEAQVLYYYILNVKYGDTLERTSGHFLAFEDLNKEVFDKGYLVPVAKEDQREISTVLIPGQENSCYRSALDQLEDRMPEEIDQIGGLIQNGASIYALYIERKRGKMLYSIIDSHGLSPAILTSENDYERAFRITFESKDDAAMFLKLHHPYTTDDIRGHTATILPLIGPREDLVATRDKNKGLMYQARIYHDKIHSKRKKQRSKDRETLRKFDALPPTSSQNPFLYSKKFESLSSSSAQASSFTEDNQTPKQLLSSLKKCTNIECARDIVLQLKKKLPVAQSLLDAYIIVTFQKNNSNLTALLERSKELKNTLKIDQEVRLAFKTADKVEKTRLIERTWREYHDQILAKLDSIVK